MDSLWWWQNTYDGSKTLGRVSEKPCFQRKIHRRSPQIVKYYGDSKLIHRTIFNTARSFGNGTCRKLPGGVLQFFVVFFSFSRLLLGVFQSLGGSLLTAIRFSAARAIELRWRICRTELARNSFFEV